MPILHPCDGPTLLDALEDPALFGPIFNRPTWSAWRVFLKALFGLPLSTEELVTYREHTGRTVAPIASAREAWLLVGRRGGKSQIAALVAVWLACFKDYSHILAPGEVGTLAVIAADRKQARTVYRYIEGLIDSVPVLSQMVTRKTQESIELNNHVVIEIHTASFRGVRGYTLIGVVADEVAFWRSEDSANPDVEILNGLRPGLATIPGALLLAITTPYARRGTAWDAYKTHFGQDDDPVLVWHGSTQTMNSSVPDQVIRDAYERDEAAASAEYGAEFRRDIETFISEEALSRAVTPGRLELPPMPGIHYKAFVDPSGGSQDSMTLAVGHRDVNGPVVLDFVREARPPFSPEEVVATFAADLARYRVSTVHGDRYGGEWPREQFRKHRVSYEVEERTKSDIYLEVLPMLTSGHVELLDHARLLAQFRGLERRTSRSGRDSVDHAPLGHDDLCNAAAGALVLVKGGLPKPFARAVKDSGPLGSSGWLGAVNWKERYREGL